MTTRTYIYNQAMSHHLVMQKRTWATSSKSDRRTEHTAQMDPVPRGEEWKWKMVIDDSAMTWSYFL